MPPEKTLVNSLKKPFAITGRTGRAGFWRFSFFCVVVILVLVLTPVAADAVANTAILVLTILLLLASIRRLRDTGMSGWLLLLPLVPVVGALALLALLARPSQSGTETLPSGIRGIIRGSFEGVRHVFRSCGAALDYLVTFIMWAGQATTGQVTQYCRKCHRRIYPPGSLYCDRCLLDQRWVEVGTPNGPSQE